MNRAATGSRFGRSLGFVGDEDDALEVAGGQGDVEGGTGSSDAVGAGILARLGMESCAKSPSPDACGE